MALAAGAPPTLHTFKIVRKCLSRVSAAFEPELADLRIEIRQVWADLKVPHAERADLERQRYAPATLELVAAYRCV